MKLLFKISIFSLFFALILFGSVVVSHLVITSKFRYKDQLIYDLYRVRPERKVDQYYLFFENLEMAKYNAWLAQKQYQDSTILGVWIPNEVNNAKYYP
jgi:hypothetical protein